MKANVLTVLKENSIHVIAILLAISTIVVAFIYNVTLSNLFGTEFEPLFIAMCGSTALSFFNVKGWKLPGIFILLVAAFSAQRYNDIHNTVALLFFIISFYKIKKDTRYSYFAWSILPAILALIAGGIFHIIGYSKGLNLKFPVLWVEAAGIIGILAFHVRYLISIIKVLKRK